MKNSEANGNSDEPEHVMVKGRITVNAKIVGLTFLTVLRALGSPPGSGISTHEPQQSLLAEGLPSPETMKAL